RGAPRDRARVPPSCMRRGTARRAYGMITRHYEPRHAMRRTRLAPPTLFPSLMLAVSLLASCHQSRVDPAEGGEVASDAPAGEPPVDACAAVRCMAGTHCVAQQDGA